MGDCKYCGKPAGIFKSEHPACADAAATRELEESRRQAEVNAERLKAERAAKAQRDQRRQELRVLCEAVLVGDSEPQHMTVLANHYGLTSELRPMQLDILEGAVAAALEDGILEHDEERALANFASACGLTQDEVNRKGAWTRLAKSAILRDVLNGVIASRINVDSMPFNLQKSETLLWVFPNTKYLEERTRRTYEGQSSGFSVRIARGLYWRTSAFKGRPIETRSLDELDIGACGITNKHIYFAGPRKSFRIQYGKIVSFQPFSDGIGLMRDVQTAKPQALVTEDGWFTYNLVSNLARL